jgi:hypothetical protein
LAKKIRKHERHQMAVVSASLWAEMMVEGVGASVLSQRKSLLPVPVLVQSWSSQEQRAWPAVSSSDN